MLRIRLALAACVIILAASASAQESKVDKAEVAERLHRVVSDKQLRQRDPDLVLEAIKAAGRYRVEQAVPDLIDLLAFRYWYDWEKGPGSGVVSGRHMILVGTRYPATTALFEIGKPALAALLDVVAERQFDSIDSKNARYTVRTILRDRPTDADDMFKRAAEEAKSSEAKDRLLKALKTADEDGRLSPEDRRPPATSP
jgi:HEAT repeat protein